ncbi:MAG: hypothetical protein IJL49_00295 [Firmicutes bacterium]|nr:hypothetical protein [Bacillota bacterium]
MEKRTKFIMPALFSIFIATMLYWFLTQVVASGGAMPTLDLACFGKNFVASEDAGNIVANLVYSFTDFGEGPFFTDFIAAIFTVAGGFLAAYLEKIGSPLKGTGTGGSGYKWYWLACSQFIALILSNYIWRHLINIGGTFVPTFTPMVSCLPMAILMFGKPNIKKAATGIIFGALLPVILVWLLIEYMAVPMGWPLFAAIGPGMAIASVIATEIYRKLPWMNEDMDDPAPIANIAPYDPEIDKVHNEAWHLTFRRAFGGDVSELYFWGANISGLGAIIGVIVSTIINPANNGCGALIPEFIFLFIFATSVGMIIWGPKYQKDGYAFTFEGVLMTGAMIGALGGDLKILIPLAIVLEFVGPAIIHWALTQKFFQRHAAAVPVQGFAGIMTIILAVIFKAAGLM